MENMSKTQKISEISKIPEFVRDILTKLESSGWEAWCVGGCVRDLLLGRTPEDWDVTTNALPEQILQCFGKQAIPTGLKHGTVTIRSNDGSDSSKSIEVTTYRLDGVYADHRRPKSVKFTGSLEDDLQRRDFTINAMALNLQGEYKDLFHGIDDLQAHCIRCVGIPDQRFQEDALRILRGLRFASILGFTIEENTAKSIQKNRELLKEIAVERIWTEFYKLLEGKHAVEILREFPEVIGVFWPEILPMIKFDQKNCHHVYDVWEHSLHALDAVLKNNYNNPDIILRCAVLLHDIGKPACFTLDENSVGHFYGHAVISRDLTDQMLRRMKCPTEFRKQVTQLVAWHDRNIPRTDRSIRRALRELGEENLRRLILVKRADNLAQAPEYHDRQFELDKAEKILDRLLEEDACFSLKQLEVNGHDLINLGFQGPVIGKILNDLLNQVIDGVLPNQRDILIQTAQNFDRQK